MSVTPVWLGYCDDSGVFALDQSKQFRDWVKKYAGQELIATFRPRSKRQGSQSMRYYRGVVIPDVAAACGYVDPDDWPSIHDAMAWKFLRLPDDQFGTPKRRSTAKDDLSQEELSHYIDQVILWAESSIPGCSIRRPEDCDLDRVTEQEFDQ